MSRVLVVGGGVMGAATAWQLSSAGVPVTLLEQFQPGHELGASHGTSRIFRLAYDDRGYVRLAQQALPLWQQLEDETGLAVLTLTGAVDHGPVDALEPMAVALAAEGAPGTWLSPGEAGRRWPGLRFDTSVLYHPTAGRVHADNAVQAFTRAAAARGAELRYGTRVIGIDVDESGATVRTDADERLHASSVVLAAGAWSAALLPRLLPAAPPLRVTQEQPAHFDPLNTDQAWPSFIHHPGAGLAAAGGPGAAVYGLASVDGIKVGFHGTGPEIDPDADRPPVDAAALEAVARYARDWVPGVDATTPRPVRCTYTSTPDSNFVIQRRGPLTVLAGFSGHGFKFAPAIGARAATLATATA